MPRSWVGGGTVVTGARAILIRGWRLARGQIVHLLDAYIANFSIDASPAVTACFSDNDKEMLQDQRAIWELTLAPPALMASQQQTVFPITVENTPRTTHQNDRR
jgi:hypothetical protein